MSGHCGDCKHWDEAPIDTQEPFRGEWEYANKFGECKKVNYVGTLAIVDADDSSNVVLLTNEDFGCVQFEGRK